MKTTGLLSTAFILCLLTAACKKDTGIQPGDIHIDKNLSVDPLKRAYFSGANRFHPFRFVPDTALRIFAVELRPGVLYRCYLLGAYMETIRLHLADSDFNVLKEGVQANIAHTAKYFTHTADEPMNAYIIAENQGGPGNENIPLKLVFEEAATRTLEWAGYTWLADGDWEVLNDSIVTHKNYNWGIFRWLRLAEQPWQDYRAVVEIRQEGGLQTSLCGMAVKSTTGIFHMLNIPETGKMFLMNGPNWWEQWHIYMGSGGGIGREFGQLPANLLTGETAWNQIRAEARPDSVYWMVNGNKTFSVLKNTYETQLYIVTDGSDTNRLYFKNFKIISR